MPGIFVCRELFCDRLKKCPSRKSDGFRNPDQFRLATKKCIQSDAGLSACPYLKITATLSPDKQFTAPWLVMILLFLAAVQIDG